MSGPPERGLGRVMVIVGLYLVLVQLHRNSGGVLASYFADTRGFSPSQIGVIVAMLYFASACAQLPTGMLFDRFGARRTLSASAGLAVAGILGFALAESPVSLTFSRAVIGLGSGGVVAGIYMLAAGWVPTSRLAGVTATVVALGGGCGAMLATAPLDAALRRIGHTQTFIAVAAATALVAVAIFLWVRDRPAGQSGIARPAPESLGESLRGLREVALDPGLRPIFVMGSCFTAPFFAVGGLWAGPYLRDVQGLDPGEAGLALMAMMVALYAGTFTYGPLDRIFGTRKWVVLGGVLVMIAMLSVLVLAPRAPLPVVMAVLVVFAFASPFFPTLAAHCRSFVPFERAGRALACLNFVGLVTATLVQIGIGVLVEATATADGRGSVLGYRLAFGLVAVLLAIAALVYLTGRDRPPAGERVR